MVNQPQDDVSLLDLLEARDIRLSDFEPDSNTSAWLERAVSRETLLTKEERLFAQRTRLTVTGTPANRNTISDEAFETAITALNASIANIDQQCAILEGHKKALAVLRTDSSKHVQGVSANGSASVKEVAQLEFDIENVTGSTRSELRSQHQKVGNIITTTSNLASRALEKDDKALDSLQKLTPRLEANNDQQAMLDSLEVLCKHWTAYEQQAVRRKVDQTYAEAIVKHKSTLNGDVIPAADSAEVKAVRAELEELSNEIDGLITLAAEHQYKGAIRKSLDQARRDAEAESAKWSEYTACVLLYLTARLDALHELHQHSHVYKAALKALDYELKDLIADHDDNGPRAPHLRESRQTSKGLKPLRLVQATFTDPQETTAQVLRLLNIQLKQPADEAALAELLRTTLRVRLRSSGDDLANLSEEQREMLQGSLNQPGEHFKALMRSISSSDGASTASGDAGKMLSRLEEQTDSLASRIHGLDVDGIAQSIAKAL